MRRECRSLEQQLADLRKHSKGSLAVCFRGPFQSDPGIPAGSFNVCSHQWVSRTQGEHPPKPSANEELAAAKRELSMLAGRA